MDNPDTTDTHPKVCKACHERLTIEEASLPSCPKCGCVGIKPGTRMNRAARKRMRGEARKTAAASKAWRRIHPKKGASDAKI